MTWSATRTLIDQARAAALGASREQVRQFFEEPPQITRELAAEMERGALPPTDDPRFATLLLERLRAHPRLAWVGYADASTGKYVGAVRYGSDEIVEYVADPHVAGGVPVQVAVARNGSRTAPSTRDTDPYFVVTRDWFKQGMSVAGPTWTPFYKWFSGTQWGITCMTRAASPAGPTPVGVFHDDLRVEAIGDFLSKLRVGPRGAVFLLDREGKRVVSPTGPHVAAAAAALDLVAARPGAISGRTPVTVQASGGVYEVAFEPAPTLGDAGVAIGVVVDRADITEGIYRNAAIASGVAVAALLLAILCALALSSRIARPLAAIAEDLERVGTFDISPQRSPSSFVREIHALGVSVDRMKASLKSFGRYVPADLVRELLAAGREAQLGGEIRRLTIHFSDVADFTSISEGMEPGSLVAAMGRYLDLATGTLTRHGGTVDKFMGDGVMAFFNAPRELPDHAHAACRAALEFQMLLARRALETPPGEPIFRARIGLGLGEVLVGNIGTPDRFAYTILGDEVNLTSRLEGLNKIYGTSILGTAALAAETGSAFEWRRLDNVAVKGRQGATIVCELLGLRGAVGPHLLTARDLYESALDAYTSGHFERAVTLFEAAATARPDDLAARMMGERARRYAANPPGDWRGIHVMHEK